LAAAIAKAKEVLAAWLLSSLLPPTDRKLVLLVEELESAAAVVVGEGQSKKFVVLAAFSRGSKGGRSGQLAW
jgi:hypothetical protein